MLAVFSSTDEVGCSDGFLVVKAINKMLGGSEVLV